MPSSSPSLHVALLGPAATQDFSELGGHALGGLPAGYPGAPFMASLARGLLERGHRVTVVSLASDMPCEHGALARRRWGPLEIVFAPMRPRAWPLNGRRPGYIWDLLRFERQGLRQALASVDPDVVHAHWPYEFAWAAIDSGLPHVVTCHDSPFRIARLYRGWRHGAYRRIRAWMAWHALRRARCVTAVSPYMVQEVASLCRSAAHLVPNPVDTTLGAARPKERAAGTRARVLMVCNGWSDLKNPQAGLRAFDMLSRVMPEVELVLLGADYEEGGVAQRWCDQAGITGRLRFVGPVRYGEVAQWMTGSDLLLHPALEESFGMVAAEALVAGLPVICGERSGALPWVVGGAGRLVDVTRPSAIAQALLELLQHGERRAQLADLGRETVKARFAVAPVVQAYEALYLRAMDDAAARDPSTVPAIGGRTWN
jgi:glycosyltransferase involved in cell wall biosynthesis